MPKLDLDFVRQQFPALTGPEAPDLAFFENAGGSYACAQTISALDAYYRRLKVQPYGAYAASAAAGQLMDESRARWAAALGVKAEELFFEPSTSQNTYVMAQAFRPLLLEDDEIIVTNQDHEANIGVWRRMADQAGARIREWRIDPDTGLLAIGGLEALLCDKTRLVCFTHCSNIVGMVNPARQIVERIHSAGAYAAVDGVSYAPHALDNITTLGADMYFFSLYKVYGVHQGVMVLRDRLMSDLEPQAHFFLPKNSGKSFVPAGPDHAQVAASGAVLDYIDSYAAHHGIEEDNACKRVAAVCRSWNRHETELMQPLLFFLRHHPRVQLIGSPNADENRVPTIAVQPLGDKTPDQIAAELAHLKIGVGSGHFYAYRCLEGLNIDPNVGVIRLSFVHYTSPDEIQHLIEVLDDVL